MATPTKSLKHADGTEVTAQEVYNAFMNSRILIVESGTTFEAISMVWYDNNSAQTNPANVGYAKLSYITTSNTTATASYIEVGDPTLPK